jgi:hypothetical protein
MSRRSRVLALAAGLGTVLAAGTFAFAQGNGAAPQPSSAAEARLAWAKRHVELVCRPLESQKMFDRATRCYNDVARLMGASRETPSAVAERAAPADKPVGEKPAAQKPAAENAPAAAPTSPAKPRPSVRPAPVRTAAASKPATVKVAAAPARVRVASRALMSAQNPSPAAPVITPASNRCSGVGCLRYTLLGVGF